MDPSLLRLRPVYALECDEDKDFIAPRVGCPCRACMIQRERKIDPRLVDLASVSENQGPATNAVNLAIHCYLVGQIDLDVLYPEIVCSLIKLSHQQHQQLVEVLSRSVPSQFLIDPSKV